MKPSFEDLLEQDMQTEAVLVINDILRMTNYPSSEYAVDLASALKSWMDNHFEDDITAKHIFEIIADE